MMSGRVGQASPCRAHSAASRFDAVRRMKVLLNCGLQ
jgi:hypothetical protein